MTYRAPAAEGTPAVVTDAAPSEVTAQVRVVDVGPAVGPAADAAASARVAGELVASFRGTGFAVVTGHGVPTALFAAMAEVSDEFFALPQEEKLAVGFPAPEVVRGYEPVPPAGGAGRDVNVLESFLVNRLDPAGDYPEGSPEHRLWRWPNRWPQRPARMRPIWERYYREMEGLGDRLLELVATGLGLQAGWFAPSFARHFSNLVVNHYPPRVPEHGDVRPRNRPHTDHGALTLLYRPDEPGGLEVYAQRRWWRVPFVPGSLVLNVGDILERWTNGALPATPHRVMTPSPEAARAGRRSIVYFQQPDPAAVVAPRPRWPL
ncbi:2OG-Fe(II) oxygenase [Pseudonocardia sp. CNS-139]|nr:2OG-Fe(II) oxygenase [Pseudonocardia sp. CNS-139]